MLTERQQAAIRHFRRHQHKAPNLKGPWHGLSPEEVEADIQTADWVPNRSEWRAQGFKNLAHAQAMLG